jgi:hypothetical protein
MKASQRWLIVASLVTVAVVSANYCLDWQTPNAYRIGNNLFEPNASHQPALFVPSPVLIKFGKKFIEFGSVPRVTITGLYPRGNMTSTEAVIGGLPSAGFCY